MFDCPNLAVPIEVMQHVVRVESSGNPYAIGVVGGRLARQPRNLSEAVVTAQMLEQQGYNFSLGIAQVNRYADSDVVKSEVKTTRLHKIVVIFRSVDMVVCEEIE